MQAGMKGSEGLEEPCWRVTKPWQTQPITFFSWLSKALTHREAQPPKAELAKCRDGAGRVVPGLVGNMQVPVPVDPGQGLEGIDSGRDWSFSRILFSHF